MESNYNIPTGFGITLVATPDVEGNDTHNSVFVKGAFSDVQREMKCIIHAIARWHDVRS